MSKKPIIVFEGIEGSGKSYHLTSVARYFFDVSNWDNSKWIVPLGASGHPSRDNYSDQGTLWKDDQVIKMQYSWSKIKKIYKKQMILKSY